MPAGDIKNGNVTIATTTNAPVTPIPGAPDCPNPQWTENITDMAFSSATITLFQDANDNGTFESGDDNLESSVRQCDAIDHACGHAYRIKRIQRRIIVG